MIVMSVVVPVLDRAEAVHEVVVESEHNPATCPPAHDHTICTQFGANLSAAAPPPAQLAANLVVRIVDPNTGVSLLRPSFAAGPPARAPPTA